MIELTIYHRDESKQQMNTLIFSADYRGHIIDGSLIHDLTNSAPFVRNALRYVACNPVVIVEHGSLSVTFDPSFCDWRTWYVHAIDGIMSYYDYTYGGHNMEVVSRIYRIAS